MVPMPAPRARPRLLPQGRAARLALLLLVAFALTRSVVWASTQPGWFAPDEDYHWHYTEYVLIEHALPDLDGPFATGELFEAAKEIRQGDYVEHNRQRYEGDPKRTLRALNGIPGSARRATGEPPRAVLHPPLYYVGSVLADRAGGSAPAPTRLTLMRYWSAALGALLVYLSWLLAAQVLSRTWAQLAAAALVATQPMVGFSSSVVGNDVLVACGFAAVLAWLCFMLRVEPHARQGIGLGVVLGLALISKSSALAVLPIVVVALALLWMSWPDRRRAMRGALAWTAGVTGAIAGPWYVYLVAVTGSIVGEKGDVLAQVPGAAAHAVATPLASLPLAALSPDDAYTWFENTYLTYWYHQFAFEVVGFNPWRLVPLAVGAIALVGVGSYLRHQRRLLGPDGRSARQLVVLVMAPVIVTLPFFVTDMIRASGGLSFLVADGRLMRPAFSATAVMCVFGLCHLFRNASWLSAGRVVAAIVALSFVNYWQTWWTWDIKRYYGAEDVLESLRRASFDKPEWVTSGSLGAAIVIAGVLFAVSMMFVVRSAREDASTAAAMSA